MTSYERCHIHDMLFHDFNGWGVKFQRSICLECRWEEARAGDGERLPVEIPVESRRGFDLHFGPITARRLSQLRARLRRLLFKETQKPEMRRMELDEAARLTAGGSRAVLERLRLFEAKHGSRVQGYGDRPKSHGSESAIERRIRKRLRQEEIRAEQRVFSRQHPGYGLVIAESSNPALSLVET